MADNSAAEGQTGSRPSFTTFWKKGKQKLTGKGSSASPESAEAQYSPSENVTENLASNDGADKPKTDKEKAQARRAQVRRAQIQHRQRKANYIKQLELDVSELRDLVTNTDKQASELNKENELIRQLLLRAGIAATTTAAPPTQQSPTNVSVAGTTPTANVAAQSQSPEGTVDPMQLDASTLQINDPNKAGAGEPSPEMFGDIDIDDWTVTLSMDNDMGTPCFHISSGSSGGSVTSSDGAVKIIGNVKLTPQQEQRAINFILALEHVCWNHFSLGDFHSHSSTTEEEKGHALMASAYCMSSAPETVYADRDALTNTKKSKFKSSQPSPNSQALQWSTGGMTLDSLYGLAASLNPGDQEVAPVQAWFELASRYHIDVLMAPGILDSLQREFRGVVRCVMFGAAIERLAFESILARVLGPSEGSIYAN